MPTPSSPTRTGAHSYITRDAVFLAILAAAFISVCCWLLSEHRGGVGAQDFRGFYAAGETVIHSPSHLFEGRLQKQLQDAAAGGDQLVTYEHPAYEALLYALLSGFRYQTAYRVYAVWNMALLWLCFLVSPPAVSRFMAEWRPALFFLSLPILLAIFVGQDSILLLLAVCLTYRALSNSNDRLAGVILGLATFKPAIVVPLALLLSIRRGRRFAGAFLGVALACGALSVGITGLRSTGEFLHLLAAATLSADHSVSAQFNHGIWLHAMPNVDGLLYLLGSGHLSVRLFNGLNITATLALLGACAWLLRRSISDSTAVAVALLGAVLASPHVYIYDLSVLPIAFLLLSGRWIRMVAILWFLLPPVLYACSFPYLMWFAPAGIVPVLLLAICFGEALKAEANQHSLLQSRRHTGRASVAP